MTNPDRIQDALDAQDQSARIHAAHAEEAATEAERIAKGLDIAGIVLQRMSAHRTGPMLNVEGMVADLREAGFLHPDEDQGDLDPHLALAAEAVKGKAASEHSIADSLWARTETGPPSLADDSAA